MSGVAISIPHRGPHQAIGFEEPKRLAYGAAAELVLLD
jgi:hypothetical protein